MNHLKIGRFFYAHPASFVKKKIAVEILTLTLLKMHLKMLSA